MKRTYLAHMTCTYRFYKSQRETESPLLYYSGVLQSTRGFQFIFILTFIDTPLNVVVVVGLFDHRSVIFDYGFITNKRVFVVDVR